MLAQGEARGETPLPVREYDLPALPLIQALIEFADQSDLTFVIPSQQLADQTSSSFSGAMRPRAALERLLEGTGFAGEITGEGVLRLIVAPAQDGAQSAGPDLAGPGRGDAEGRDFENTVPAGNAGVPFPDAPMVSAPERPDVIYVTARKREERAQDVPFSLNVQTESAIRMRGATDLETLSGSIAGLTVQNLGPGQSQVAIRGISAGQIVRDQPGVKEQVGVYLDESVVSLSLFTPDFDLFDLDRIETLRGPQGTLFGSGSMAGTVRYITRQPEIGVQALTLETDAHTLSDGGTGGAVRGAGNIPLGQNAALRLVAYHSEYAGYIDAVRPDLTVDEDINSGSRMGLRLSAVFQPTPEFSITPRIVLQNVRADGFNREDDFHILANTYTQDRPRIALGEDQQFLLVDERYTDDFLLGDLVVNWSLDDVELTSVTSFTDRDVLVSRDASALTGSVSYDLGMGDAAVVLPSNLQDRTSIQVFTQEIRATSTGDGPVQWLAGLFYSDLERDYGQTLPTPGWDAAALAVGLDPLGAQQLGPVDSPFYSRIPYNLEQVAIFGEVSLDLTERLNATVGLRAFEFDETRSLTFDGFFAAETDSLPGHTGSSGLSPRVLLSFDINPDWTLNGQISKGFRLGGINDPLNSPLCSPADLALFSGRGTFSDETVWNYETGLKGALFDGRARVYGAVFYADIRDLQATVDAGTCSSRLIFNVADAHSAGAEFEFEARLSERWDVSFAASYADSQLDTTLARPGTSGMSVINGIEDGNRLPTVPRLQVAATASWTAPVNARTDFFLSGTAQHIGNRITQFGDMASEFGRWELRGFGGVPAGAEYATKTSSPDYLNINLRAGLQGDDWEAALYVNNVMDERALLSLDRERGGFARVGWRSNQPRTIGVTLRLTR